MKSTFLHGLLSVLLLVCFTGCKEDMIDGKLSPLTWEECSGIELGEWSASVNVPAEGASYLLVCTNPWPNYGIWLSSVSVDEQFVTLDEEQFMAEGEWGSVVCEEEKLSMTIAPNHTGKVRVIEVKPTRIGCFYTFILTQPPLAE